MTTQTIATQDVDVTHVGEMTYIHIGHISAELWPVEVEGLIDQLRSHLDQIEVEHPVKEC